MFGVTKRKEGEPISTGLSWQWDKHSQPMLILKVARLTLVMRRRSAWVMSGNIDKPRYIFMGNVEPQPNLSIDWRKHFDLGGTML